LEKLTGAKAGLHNLFKPLSQDVKMEELRKIFADKLLAWHQKNAIKFPWRETRDTYKILLAEILLRKTTRKQVKEIFESFIKKYPSMEMLASANIRELERVIKPLGMQRKRAHLIIRLAKVIMEKYGGEIPRDRNSLIKLPGIGPYSANAVLCLAYDEQLPLVDTNVIRVIERVFQVKSKKARARTDPMIWSFMENLIPNGKAREFNLAVLDFANLICVPKVPKCPICPVHNICLYSSKTKQSDLERYHD